MGQAKWWGWGDEGVVVHARGQAGPRAVPRACPRARRARHDVARPSAFDELDIPEPTLPAGLRAALEARRRERRARLHRRARPRRPRARQEPARPRAPPPRRPRPAARRRGPPRRRGRGRRGRARRARRRRRGHPVRRRHEHLGQPRGARGRDAHGRLGRPRPHGPRARDRRHVAGSPASRPGVFGPDLEEQLNAQRLDRRPLPRQLHPLDARRLDRDALVGHAVRQVRRHRRPHARRARGHARRACSPRARCRATSTGPSVREMVLGSEGRLGIITEATVHVHRAARAAA